MTLVALLGPDGSGKSTLIRELVGSFEEGDVELHHFRVSLKPKSDTPVRNPYTKPAHPAVVAVVKMLWWHALHSTWGLTRRARGGQGSGIVIFDRFLYDVLADPRRYRVPRWVADLPWTVLVWPKPDLTVILEPPLDVIRARKQEVDERETDIQLAAYRGLLSGESGVLRLTEALEPSELVDRVRTALAGVE